MTGTASLHWSFVLLPACLSACLHYMWRFVERLPVWRREVGLGAGPVTEGTRTGRRGVAAAARWSPKRQVR